MLSFPGGSIAKADPGNLKLKLIYLIQECKYIIPYLTWFMNNCLSRHRHSRAFRSGEQWSGIHAAFKVGPHGRSNEQLLHG